MSTAGTTDITVTFTAAGKRYSVPKKVPEKESAYTVLTDKHDDAFFEIYIWRNDEGSIKGNATVYAWDSERAFIQDDPEYTMTEGTVTEA